ncbi:hypothetical protein TSAR_005868 [Trichomalopsis sarcophagae]|uniref:trypsin n=1 Tax=Trichomalopsis sarcophagae TaxID=543379 RepID=A0A232F5Q1_9HYME|nr:hypothetical protein TSAR_005868 [Trichomalopsis sarcophagae]
MKHRRRDHLVAANMLSSVLVLAVSALVLVVAADPVALPLALRNQLNPFTPQGRIVGGKDVKIEEVPYQVLLEARGFGFCGGSIIAEDWILTAGHCIVYSDDWVSVRAGTTKRSSGGSLHKVVKSIRHEEYGVNRHGIPINDIALLKLATKLDLDETRQPITLFEIDEAVEAGELSVITGWGTLRQGGRTSEILQTVSVPVISRQVCSQAYAAFGGIPEGQICAAHPAGGKDACQGDSGGPLAVSGRLAGVVSWGNGCAQKGYPGAYTEVAAFRKWISEKTGL